ncbi:MAG: DUF1800 domain-containing protein [Longimicrobiales bacterium]
MSTTSVETTDSVAPEQDPIAAVPEVATDSTPKDGRATRRALFTMGAAFAAAALASPGKAAAQRIVRPHTTRPRPPAPPPGDSLQRLVRRITNGVTEEEMNRARSMGFQRYLDYHLRPSSINDDEVETNVVTRFPSLALDGTGLFQQDQNALGNQLAEATMYRAAFSKRQLYERMVHFWTDHFTIYYPKVNYLKLLDDRDVIRAHALGKFHDMLRASAHSPAMLEYLDNTRSRARSVNQNYAREIMELHTLGVDGGYTQTDVEEVTRCLTGWTIQGRGVFRFDPSGHDFTEKTVLGRTIAAMPTSAGAAAIQDGETVLDILLAHPSTARFIAFKMIRWLLRYDPPPALVDKVAATFTRTGGDIPAMIRDILTPANLMAAPAKYRQPYQLVLAAIRAAQPTGTNFSAISGGQLRNLGQALFQWEDPDGWPDNVDWWSGLILQRWNFCTFITSQTAGNTPVDVTTLMLVNTPDAIAEALNRRAFAGEMPATLKQQVTAFLAAAPINANRVREAFALVLSSNAFQWF